MMVPFKYGDFYDVPRLIVFRFEGHLICMGNYFDEGKDDYEDDYSIFLLPPSSDANVSESIFKGDFNGKLLGKVPVKSVIFDSSKRKALDAHFLKRYLNGV